MLETPHVLVGIALAIKTGNPAVAIPASFVSHFILDHIPHWNPHINTEIKKYGKLTVQTKTLIAIDTTVAISAAAVFAFSYINSDLTMSATILLAAFAAMLPDILEAPYFLFGFKNKTIDWWIKTQKAIQSDANIFWGNLTQVLTIVASLYWIFN